MADRSSPPDRAAGIDVDPRCPTRIDSSRGYQHPHSEPTHVTPARPIPTHPAISPSATSLPLKTGMRVERCKEKNKYKALYGAYNSVTISRWRALGDEFVRCRGTGSKCHRPQVLEGIYCTLHTCHAILADGERCDNPTAPDSKYCTQGYHYRNGRQSEMDDILRTRRRHDHEAEQQAELERMQLALMFDATFPDLAAGARGPGQPSVCGLLGFEPNLNLVADPAVALAARPNVNLNAIVDAQIRSPISPTSATSDVPAHGPAPLLVPIPPSLGLALGATTTTTMTNLPKRTSSASSSRTSVSEAVLRTPRTPRVILTEEWKWREMQLEPAWVELVAGERERDRRVEGTGPEVVRGETEVVRGEEVVMGTEAEEGR